MTFLLVVTVLLILGVVVLETATRRGYRDADVVYLSRTGRCPNGMQGVHAESATKPGTCLLCRQTLV